MKKQVFNPFLPSWEYIPDGEPHVFGDRIYLYGSHDRFGGEDFCLNTYVGWSAPIDDLSDWKFHGETYDTVNDPFNRDRKWTGYAPDACIGPDGRYYFYYAINNDSVISVAVCDDPAGKFEFYGHIKLPDGRIYGTKEGDVFCFDPGVLVDDDGTVHLYIGFSPTWELSDDINDNLAKARIDGAYHFELESDMVTIKGEPTMVCHGMLYTKGTSFEGHGVFEAPSIRKFNGKYYFIYSSENYHELCYAIGDRPEGPFTYGGVLVSDVDIGINGNTEPLNYPSNNHGSVEKIGDDYYVFFHRHTNKTMYSRQACAEKIIMLPDGHFVQAEVTSCGLNGGALSGKGVYEARIACNLSSDGGCSNYGWDHTDTMPYFTQTGEDREENGTQYIAYMDNGSWAGFKYFKFSGGEKIKMTAHSDGEGYFEVCTMRGGEVVVKIPVIPTEEVSTFEGEGTLPGGTHALYFTYRGKGHVDFISFELY